MNDLTPYTQWIFQQSELFFGWVNSYVLTMEAVVQFSLIAGLFVAAKVFSLTSAKWMRERFPDKQIGVIKFYASYREIFFLLYLVLFAWSAVLVSQAIALPFQLLKVTASLTTAWAVIRFTSSTIESHFWSRLIALVLWIMAALNIVGWLSQAIELMDKAALNVGDVKLSLLLVVKSIFAFAILLWCVRVISGILQRSFNRAKGLNPSQKVLFFKLSNITLYVIGIVVGLNIVGLDLTALTVFSGALGLGIGFGLQKVFSNLISGIILLLDKSVKPGDVVAIGDTYGWVNSLGARCVSVLTRDGKEHLIPNEVLITEKVENWSYSDKKIRVRIPVGVSYDSDMQLVRELLLKAVGDHPRVLKHPKPTCLIMGFGDNSVDHELRAWISDPSEGVGNVRSAIYYRIWEMFKEHNVSIPYPQRDVHLDIKISEALERLLQLQDTKKAETG